MTGVIPGFAGCVIAWQRWSGRHGLPWQDSKDPYRVWLSEVMLQQTQVATVLRYYDRFLQQFPTVNALARASQDDVLALWSGLGYYSRARNLHRCAQAVMALHGGEFPRTAALLQTLPGIGRSTAAAIAAFCFGERAAILDANVRRVLTRVLAFERDTSIAAHQQALWGLATDLLPRRDLIQSMPTYTQGLMDLGATVCTPKNPQCGACPVRPLCRANAQSNPQAYPKKTRKIRRTSDVLWLLWAQSGPPARRNVWLQRRPDSGIWAGLYSLPDFVSEEQVLDCVPTRARSGAQHVPAFTHVLTHKDLHLHPVRAILPAGTSPGVGGAWFTLDEALALGLPAPIRSLLQSG